MTRYLAPVLLGLVLATGAVHQGFRGWQRLESSQLVWEVQGQRASGLLELGVARPEALETALEMLERARALEPLGIEPIALQGDLLLAAGRAEAAAAVYRQGLRLEQRPELYFNLGLSLWSLDQDGEALEAFRRSLALDHRLRDQVPPELLDRI